MLRQGRRSTIRAAWLVLLGTLWLLSSAGHAAAGPRGELSPRQRTGRLPGKPAYLWLWYATGKAIPEDAQYCGDLAPPPPYQCNFGSKLDDCQAQVQAFLDDWYKDFNLVFTLTRPPSGDYYTIVITSGWPDCASYAATLLGGAPEKEGGIAPGNCLDNPLATGIAIQCGMNAHDCAAIIAHEHAHLVGLVHTNSDTDLMSPTIQRGVIGFVDDDNMTAAQDVFNSCGLGKQNSYQRMLSALGPWPGGAKPGVVSATWDAGALAATPDAGAPDGAAPGTADAPAIGTSTGPGQGPTIDGSLTVSSGFDAIARTPPVIPDAGPAKVSPSSKGGCTLARSPGSPSLFLVVGALLVCLLLSLRASLSRAVAARARTVRGS